MIKQQTSDVKRYSEILESLNLKQVVAKATRTTKSSKTLVDDVITNLPKRVTNTDVLPRTLDHDASLSRGIQFSRASLNGALTQHKNRDIKTHNLLCYKGNMYCRRYCLKWRFSLILNSLRVSTCPMILGTGCCRSEHRLFRSNLGIS